MKFFAAALLAIGAAAIKLKDGGEGGEEGLPFPAPAECPDFSGVETP